MAVGGPIPTDDKAENDRKRLARERDNRRWRTIRQLLNKLDSGEVRYRREYALKALENALRDSD
jgi:hypothetical protein